MKMTIITKYGLTYFAGIASAILLLSIYSFTRPATPVGPPEPVIISVPEANALFLEYYKTAKLPDKPIRGLYLQKEQLNVMNRLVADDVDGFRIYLGKEKTGEMVGIVVGVDKNNLDLVTKQIFKTSASNPGPCPTVCDSQSPIIKN